jgi:DNA-binding GntR family transcriptional regulator
MLDDTQNYQQAIDDLIEEVENSAPKSFPYTTRELAARFGVGNSTVSLYLHSKGLITKGRRWFFQHNPERHE